MKMFSSLSGVQVTSILNVTIFKYSLHKLIETILRSKIPRLYHSVVVNNSLACHN